MRVTLIVSLLVLLSIQFSAVSDDPPLKLSAEEQALVDLTNAERKKESVEALKPQAKLMQAAREHAANMAKQDKMDHELDGKSMSDRIKEIGYIYSHLGENIAHNKPTPKRAVADWMESEEHKMNILSKDYEDIGVGVAKSANGKLYWLQVFGAPLAR